MRNEWYGWKSYIRADPLFRWKVSVKEPGLRPTASRWWWTWTHWSSETTPDSGTNVTLKHFQWGDQLSNSGPLVSKWGVAGMMLSLMQNCQNLLAPDRAGWSECLPTCSHNTLQWCCQWVYEPLWHWCDPETLGKLRAPGCWYERKPPITNTKPEFSVSLMCFPTYYVSAVTIVLVGGG